MTEFLVAALIILSGAVGAVFKMILDNKTRVSVLEARPDGEAAGREIAAMRADFADFKLCVERNFVRRDQWVPAMSRIEGMLEAQGKLLERLDERYKPHER